MKKTMLTLIAFMMLVSPVQAKKVKDITAHDVASVPKVVIQKVLVDGTALLAEASYKSVRLVLKGLAQPFYWLEKIGK
jgi:hypothetical protein